MTQFIIGQSFESAHNIDNKLFISIFATWKNIIKHLFQIWARKAASRETLLASTGRCRWWNPQNIDYLYILVWT